MAADFLAERGAWLFDLRRQWERARDAGAGADDAGDNVGCGLVRHAVVDAFNPDTDLGARGGGSRRVVFHRSVLGKRFLAAALTFLFLDLVEAFAKRDTVAGHGEGGVGEFRTAVE